MDAPFVAVVSPLYTLEGQAHRPIPLTLSEQLCQLPWLPSAVRPEAALASITLPDLEPTDAIRGRMLAIRAVNTPTCVDQRAPQRLPAELCLDPGKPDGGVVHAALLPPPQPPVYGPRVHVDPAHR